MAWHLMERGWPHVTEGAAVRVVMAGGGTAGHVLPAIVVADRLRATGADVIFVGSADGPEGGAVTAAGYRFEPMRVVSSQTRVSMRSAAALWHAGTAARAVRPLVRTADVVVGFGGYASAPAILASRWSKVPIVLIEQNGVPGAVNRLAARWARVVATTFDATAARLPEDVRVVRTGNPLRPEIAHVLEARAGLRGEAHRMFELEPDRRTVGVFGGSQGAFHLNQAVVAAIPLLRGRGDLQLLISAGPAHEALFDELPHGAEEVLVRAFGFIDRMDLALAATDVAVSRAGSGAITELTACGVPTILVPYPHATENHQEANARELERAGAAEVVLDRDLSGERVAGGIVRLLDDRARSVRMGAAARAWAMPDASGQIAALIAEVVAA